MTTYYIDPAQSSNGTGTTGSPFNTWIGVPVAAGHVYKQLRGTTWSGAFPSLTNGTSGNITTVAAYANADGSDNTALAKPIINIGDTMMPGTINSPKTFIKFSMVDIRCARVTSASDTPIMWVGSDMEISDCALTSNLTALYGDNRSRAKILRNTITAATQSSATHSMNALVLAGTSAMDGNEVEGNTILIGDGGTNASHVMRLEASGGGSHSNLKVRSNHIRTVSGLMTTNVAKIGIYVNNSPGAKIALNDVSLMLSGVFANGCSGVEITDNILNGNGNFGVHVTTNTSGFKILRNKCRRNGSATGMSYYGRGIELSAGKVLHSCTAHIIAFNDCSYNYNWGGPFDNGTEGCGIGLDDATSFCLVYGNLCYRNEGNGIQVWGGDPNPSDTGGNIICGNHLIENATASILNRRSGGTYITAGAVNMSFARTLGSRTTVANNLIVGGFGGLRIENTSANVSAFNNVFMDQASYAIAAASTANISTNVYKTGIPKNIGNLTLGANNVPTPALLSSGVSGDLTTDPLLDTVLFMPLAGSPLLGRSIAWAPVPPTRSDL